MGRRQYRFIFIASDVTPETASGTMRRHPALPKTAADDLPGLSVVIVATDHQQRAVLQSLVRGSGIGRTVLTCSNFPVATSDPVVMRVQAADPVVILVDIPADNPPSAVRAIELFNEGLPNSTVFAIGSLNQSHVIVDAMRAGAREFIQRPVRAEDLLAALGRLTTRHRHLGIKTVPVGSVETYRQQSEPILPGAYATQYEIRDEQNVTSIESDFADQPSDTAHGGFIVVLPLLWIALIGLWWGVHAIFE